MKLSQLVVRNRRSKRRRTKRKKETGDSNSGKENYNATEKDMFESSKGPGDEQEVVNKDLLNYDLDVNKENYEYDEDEEDLQLQAVLLSSMTTGTSSFCKESNVSTEKKEDLKMKGIAKPCSMNESFGYNSSSSNCEGESSCTFCVICDEAKAPGLMEYSNRCGHSFCTDCIKNYVHQNFQENPRKVYCPETNCKRFLPPKLCFSFLTEEMKILRENTVDEMKALEKETIIQCPFEDCFASFYDDQRGYPIIACPECCRLMCFFCGKPYAGHLGLSCEEFEEEQIRLTKRIKYATKIQELVKIADYQDKLVLVSGHL